MSSRQILNHTVPCAVKRAGIADRIGAGSSQPDNPVARALLCPPVMLSDFRVLSDESGKMRDLQNHALARLVVPLTLSLESIEFFHEE